MMKIEQLLKMNMREIAVWLTKNKADYELVHINPAQPMQDGILNANHECEQAMQKKQCKNCIFYHIEQQTTRDINDDSPLHECDHEAECRRYPPVRVDADYAGRMGEQGVLRDHFSGPIVQAISWCGEWRSRDNGRWQ